MSNRFRLLSGFWAFMLISSGLNQLFPQTLVLDTQRSFELAIENNTALQSSRLDLDNARRSAANSWNHYLPSITARVSLDSGSTPIGESYNWGLGPGVSINLPLSAGTSEAIRQLQIGLRIAELRHQEQERQLLFRIEQEFHALLTAREDLAIRARNIELANNTLQQTRIRFENGLASELEVLQARVNAANLLPAYSSLQAAYANRLSAFLQLIGIDPQSDVRLEGDLTRSIDLPDTEALLGMHLRRRPDLRILENQILLQESSIRQLRNSRAIPVLSLSASWSDRYNGLFADGSWQDGSFKGRTSFSAGLSLGLDNFFPGSASDTRISNQQNEIKKIKLAYKEALQKAEMEIRSIINSLQSDLENIELSQLNKELAEHSYQMSEISFREGRVPAATLDRAQQELLTARQNLLESRRAYWHNLAELRQKLGLGINDPLEGGVLQE